MRNTKPETKPARFSALVLLFALLFVMGAVQGFGDRLRADAASRGEITEELSSISERMQELREGLRAMRSQEEALQDDIAILNQEIELLELSLERAAREVALLDEEISRVAQNLEQLKKEMAQEREALGMLMRAMATQEHDSLVAVVFSQHTLATVMNAVAAQERIQQALVRKVRDIEVLKEELARERKALQEERSAQEETRTLLAIARDDLAIKQEIKERLLSVAESASRERSRELRAAELEATQLRMQLYLLDGTGSVKSLEEVYPLAKRYAESVGIRPAFLLAVLQKESHLGASVGTGNWREDMNPARDWDAFLQITRELGVSPDAMPVSARPSYGWGGAMGPAQFLPSTWLAYKDRIAAMTGNSPPSPWSLEDAIAGAAVKLAAGGATAKIAEAEWRAAMIYFAGGNWDEPRYAFYGDAVEALTALFTQRIAELENNGT